MRGFFLSSFFAIGRRSFAGAGVRGSRPFAKNAKERGTRFAGRACGGQKHGPASTSLFDQRHRFVFSGVYQTGKVGHGFAGAVASDWTFAPLVELASGRPFNILTGSGDNLQLSSLTSRPNTTVDPACGAVYNSKFSPSGTFQEPCINGFIATGTVPALLQLDGNLRRNAGLTPWVAFGDLRVSKRVYFTERFSADFIVDMFNIANRNNTAAVSPLFSNAGVATAAYDPRQFQFAMKINW